MSKLPIGIQSFEKLREDGYLYIDKTEYIVELLEGGSVYFLSRPRRFGKSLLISTMEAYFLGKKELFDHLAIAEYEAEKPEKEQWIRYPVMTFSLSGGEYQSPGGLEDMLDSYLARYESMYLGEGQTAPGKTLTVRFGNLIEMAAAKCGRPVVVLVDEYDKPLLENLSVNPEQEEKNRTLFKNFFSVLKDKDQYLKFAFFTGVTKFSKVSIFSDLNQLKDISLLPKYSAICGITEKEMTGNLAKEIDSLAQTLGKKREDTLKALAKMYDGYHFSADGEGVYNPFSLLNAFADGNLGRYWFETGTPSFLIRMMTETGMPAEEFGRGVQASQERLENYRAEGRDLVPLFYQSGYLTITGYDRIFQEYTLSYPNDEVRYGYLNALIPMAAAKYSSSVPDPAFSVRRMITYLRTNEMEPFMTMLQALLAGIPYHEGKTPASEQQWRNVVYAIFTVLGQYVRCEVHSSRGRSDCIVENEHYVYLFEFKQDKSAREALEQIEDRGYALPYAACGKQVVKIGANFSTQMRTLSEWKIVMA